MAHDGETSPRPDASAAARGRLLCTAMACLLALSPAHAQDVGTTSAVGGSLGTTSAIGATSAIGTIGGAGVPSADPDPAGCAKPLPSHESSFLESRVVAPRKEAWQNGHGGLAAAKEQVRARLAGWPTRIVVDRSTLPADDAGFLRQLARDTWNGLAAFVDREHGLPIDHVRLCGGALHADGVKIGDYTSGTNIGLHLASIAGAFDLELISRDEAIARARHALASLRRLETHEGFFFNYYDTTTLERTSPFVSFVDSAWLTTGLIVLRQTFPELWAECSHFLDRQDYALFYDPRWKLMLHGFDVKDGRAEPARFHYGTLYTEARLGSLIAIGQGHAPEALWFAMRRTLPESMRWQRQRPIGRRIETVRGHRVAGGTYEWRGVRYVPSWGGSMFEALMPAIALDERAHAPRSLGRNGEAHALIHRRYALEELGWPVWGMSPSAQPDKIDYAEFGVPELGVAGYRAGVVTPHASALALPFAPEEATANLRRIAERYDAYGEFGLYDALDPKTGAVAYAYLTLDQSMSFVALVNHLKQGSIQKRFAADPAVAPALPLLRDEDFFD